MFVDEIFVEIDVDDEMAEFSKEYRLNCFPSFLFTHFFMTFLLTSVQNNRVEMSKYRGRETNI